MNANISNATKGKTVRSEEKLADRRPENSSGSLPTGQTGRRIGDSQRDVNQLLNSSSKNTNPDVLKPGILEIIPSVEGMTDIKSTISDGKDDPKEIEDTEAPFGEEVDDVIVNIKPMQPITRVSTYGYMSGLGSLSSTHSFTNKLQSSGLRYFSDINGSRRGRLGLSKQILMSEDCTSLYDNLTKRTSPTNKMISDVRYSSDAESVDLAAGYMSDGDVLRPGLVYRVDDIAAGYMSEGGASFYGRNISTDMKDGIMFFSKTINVLQDDRSINAFPLRSQYKT
ncbi:uncharacterized protein LOC111083382, partial [Limulus polyphemus]|uniref:Uncharacterized protein LOC111083382 n=1 Tax=Limulus polyphemus TaxID=6850 RepID=A0ABM1RW31_LIMPO